MELMWVNLIGGIEYERLEHKHQKLIQRAELDESYLHVCKPVPCCNPVLIHRTLVVVVCRSPEQL
jgi:hypothetical protein